jgi:hypothetical protein
VIDAPLILDFYRTQCRAQGHAAPAVILGAQ